MNTCSLSRRDRDIVPIAEAYLQSDGAVARGLSRDQLFNTCFIDPATQGHISIG